MSMNAMYTNNQLQTAAERVAAQQQERQARLDGDPVVVTARRKLEKAQGDYEELQTYVKTLPLQRRLEYNLNIQTAKQDLDTAEKGLREAINSNSSAAYASKVQQEQAEKAKQQKQAEAQRAQELEAEAKQQYRPHFLAAGGRSGDFEQAWTSTIWPKMVQERAAQEHAKLQLQLKTGYTL